jgi:hypothetical protein
MRCGATSAKSWSSFRGGEALRQAQADAAGQSRWALTGQRRRNAMIRQAKVLAEQAGVGVSADRARSAGDALAALAQPEIADEVRSGRLTKAASCRDSARYLG